MYKNNLLCFCLPTHNIDDMFDYLLPTLKNIGELKNYCSFSITFQPPYTENDINKVLEILNELNLTYKYEYKEYQFERGQTPLIQMRNDCALRYPKALFYALLDDDMSFMEGIDTQYLNLLQLMLKDRNISVATIKSPIQVIDNMPKPKVSISYNDFENAEFFTESGIIYRGGIYYGFDGLLPEDMLQYIGGRQDVLTAIWRILQGESSININDGKCNHYENRSLPGYLEYNWLNTNLEYKTCTSWLESKGYIRHILHMFDKDNVFFINFSKVKCEELYKKGCKSSQNYYLDYVRETLIPLDKIVLLIDNYLNEIED